MLNHKTFEARFQEKILSSLKINLSGFFSAFKIRECCGNLNLFKDSNEKIGKFYRKETIFATLN